MQIETPHRRFRTRSTQIPQLDRLIRTRTRQQTPMLGVPRERKDGIDVMVGVGRSSFDELLLLLTGSERDRDVLGGDVGTTEESIRVESVYGIEGPDFDFGVEGSDGDVASVGLTGTSGGGGSSRVVVFGGTVVGREVEPFEAEWEGWEHEIVVDVEVLFGFVVDVDFELGEVVFGFGGDEEVVGGKNLEVFSFEVVVVLRKRKKEEQVSFEKYELGNSWVMVGRSRGAKR